MQDSTPALPTNPEFHPGFIFYISFVIPYIYDKSKFRLQLPQQISNNRYSPSFSMGAL